MARQYRNDLTKERLSELLPLGSEVMMRELGLNYQSLKYHLKKHGLVAPRVRRAKRNSRKDPARHECCICPHLPDPMKYVIVHIDELADYKDNPHKGIRIRRLTPAV